PRRPASHCLAPLISRLRPPVQQQEVRAALIAHSYPGPVQPLTGSRWSAKEKVSLKRFQARPDSGAFIV
ncbi:hypothetical protein FBU31_005778, partial [Coemansia sp. 'formosensis']